MVQNQAFVHRMVRIVEEHSVADSDMYQKLVVNVLKKHLEMSPTKRKMRLETA